MHKTLKHLIITQLLVLFCLSHVSALIASISTEKHPFYDVLLLHFNKAVPDYVIDVSKNTLTLTFAEEFSGIQPISEPYAVTVSGKKIDVAINGKVFWYRAEKGLTQLAVFLYRYPRTYYEESSPVPSFTTIADYVTYKKGLIEASKKPIVIYKQPDTSQPINGTKQWLIVIDPGHGGKAYGAIGPSSYKEKDLTLSVCNRLLTYLKDNPRIKVLMTRGDDRYVSLYDRANLANKNKADFFISVHANAPGKKQNPKRIRGIETFYLSEALTDEDRALAILENEDFKYEQDYQNQSTLELLLSDMAQNQYMKESSDLSYMMQQHLISGTRWIDRGVKQAPFYVLRFCYMPSVLVEIGFITNPDEEKLLKSAQYQDIIAKKIADSIKEYIDKHDRVLSNK